MFMRFEEYAAASMLGEPDSPPRLDGKLFFTQRWERDVFGLALSLSKAGCFEWEDFRQSLIASIARWESIECANQPRWDYYERFLEALVSVVESSGIISRAELERVLTARKTAAPIAP
ncbi:nitrile hydratase accessory protein [Paraburkholderia sp. SOS3]|jgi:nitrile hydratase accessory protein|uniref:nitrile hydratase accessory protein n=1 Tax=Paraburkholderia sp. SOS3 TaxID=1926494 RepID=UPI00094756B8|nr:nitrile hydratase accessory protein [Paraburkholderia sp. SOS3]APR38511.1 nitrile hydratase accessory protein [Paraburkholderia sp. SOS3]